MNEETLHPGTKACLLQIVYSVNYYANTVKWLSGNTYSLVFNEVSAHQYGFCLIRLSDLSFSCWNYLTAIFSLQVAIKQQLVDIP